MVGEEFFNEAPYVFHYEKKISASKERIFQQLSDWENWPSWYSAVKKIKPTCGKPFGLNSTRITTMSNGIAADETFFIWEKNSKIAFYTTSTNIPCASALAEVYEIIEIDEGQCLFKYTVAMDPILLLKVMGPIGKFFVEKTFSGAADGLAKYVESLA